MWAFSFLDYSLLGYFTYALLTGSPLFGSTLGGRAIRCTGNLKLLQVGYPQLNTLTPQFRLCPSVGQVHWGWLSAREFLNAYQIHKRLIYQPEKKYSLLATTIQQLFYKYTLNRSPMRKDRFQPWDRESIRRAQHTLFFQKVENAQRMMET